MTARLRRWCVAGSIAAAVSLSIVPMSMANTPQVPVNVGRMWFHPEYDGAEGWSGSMMQYPAGIPVLNTEFSNNMVKRGWVGHGQKTGSYLMTTDWTDPAATTHEFASSYFFRTMNYDYPAQWLSGAQGFNYLYPGGVQEYFRWTRPVITVMNAATATASDTTVVADFFPGEGVPGYPDNAGTGPRPDPLVDADLVTEQAVYMWWRYIQGVEYQRWLYAYPEGTPHQDYQLWDIDLVNNGISGTNRTGEAADDPPVLTNQTINNMVWAQNYDHRDNNAPRTSQVGMDNDAMFVEPWGSPGHDAVLAWDGDDQTVDGNPGPDWGDPAENDFYQGHMMGNAYAMLGALFASAGPGAQYAVDDTMQPAYKIFRIERGLDFAGTGYPADPAGQREQLVSGDFTTPLRTSYRDDPFTAPIANTTPGATIVLGYGPVNADITFDNYAVQGWDLGWLDTVRVVQMWAVGGIDRDTAQAIGQIWNEQRAAEADPATWMSVEHQEYVKTGRDTVMKAAALAYWNFNGTWAPNVTAADLDAWGLTGHLDSKPAAYNQPYNVPEAPRPPAQIVTLQDPAGIQVRWTTETEDAPDHDTGVQDAIRYRVYRQSLSRSAPFEIVAEESFDWFPAVDAQGDLPAGRVFIDRDVVTGQSYFYAVTVLDDGTQNWAQPGTVLESSRWWTWTGFSPVGTVAGTIGAVEGQGPSAFSLSQNAPNPFNPSTTINFSLATAGETKLAIYNTNGQMVRSLVDGTLNAGTHQVVWDGMDQAGRSVASGVYVYRLTNGTNVMAKRMVLVR